MSYSCMSNVKSLINAHNKKINRHDDTIPPCETTFKKRHATHKNSFNHERYRNSTTLSAEYWRIKELNGTPSVTWRVVKHAKSYTPETKNCQLCLCEKFEIANYPGKDLLNKRTEIVAKCRHRSKHLLMNFGVTWKIDVRLPNGEALVYEYFSNDFYLADDCRPYERHETLSTKFKSLLPDWAK